MKQEIEIEDDLTEWGLNYCVYATTLSPYRDRDNYLYTNRSEPDKLTSDCIDNLYEQMGSAVVQHMLHGEKQSVQGSGKRKKEKSETEKSSIDSLESSLRNNLMPV